MARKDRTPPPPRKVQAPKVRHPDRRRPDRRRLLLVGGAGALALVVVVGVVVAAVALAGGGSDVRKVLTQAGCTLKTYPAQEGQHVSVLPKGFEYNSTPPTSGPHNPTPAIFDFYDEQVVPLNVIHNLEHGGVLVQFGDKVPQAQRDALTDWYRNDPSGLVVSPRSENGAKFTLTAWVAEGRAPEWAKKSAEGTGVLATCPAFDREAFEAFVDQFGFKGPEPYRRGDLQQGTFGVPQ